MENIVRKGEIAYNKQILFFSQCFLPYMALIFHFKMSSAICYSLDQSEILSSGNGLIHDREHNSAPYHRVPSFDPKVEVFNTTKQQNLTPV